MKAWLKGGLIAGILDILVIMLAFRGDPFDAVVLGLGITQIPISWLYTSMFGISNMTDAIILSLLGILNWFIIGSLIGWLVGGLIKKIKK